MKRSVSKDEYEAGDIERPTREMSRIMMCGVPESQQIPGQDCCYEVVDDLVSAICKETVRDT